MNHDDTVYRDDLDPDLEPDFDPDVEDLLGVPVASDRSIAPPTSQGEVVGIVGSPSSTGEITMDVVESASGASLLGDLIYTCHPLDGGRHMLALGSVGEISTHNRWHEDPNMRGVLRVHGALPHLSGDGDVRTATVQVQAVYETDAACPPFAENPRESGGALGMSPTTGQPVRRVDEGLVQALVQRHQDDVVYLGRVYRSDVRLPMFVRDYTGPATDGAYHVGIFGRSGSGKTAFATYWLAMQLRHPELSVLVFDPQGQFARQPDGFVLDLQGYARQFGRDVHTLSIAEDIQMPKDAPLALELLEGTSFFRHLTIKMALNREAAVSELERKLQAVEDWEDSPADEVLRAILQALADDDQALQRIFSGKPQRERLTTSLLLALSDEREFGHLLADFGPIHSLFTREATRGQRLSLRWLLHRVLDQDVSPKPYVIVDLSSRSGTPWLDSAETKARLMRKIAHELRQMAERTWRESGGNLINCSVVFDEAHRFAPAKAEGEEVERLSARLVDYVRETRKTGLGWTFITQEIGSLNPGIFTQLRVRAYGYGMTSGSDLNKLRDEVGRDASLSLYQSFPDPNSLSEKVYPFMITGPVSPLSFTAAPIFLQVFTDEAEFRDANHAVFEPGGS
ncbi:ATP-binding protein [Nocardioides sp.]|uniref:ATP-binding protein n=1 Tax=Nocardioides sp. TaxID=35761 RepID=UPI0035B27D67